MAVKTPTQLLADHPITSATVASNDVFPVDDTSAVLSGGITFADIQAAAVTDAYVAALATVAGNTANISTLQSQVTTLNAKGGLIGTQGPGSVLVSSTTDTQLSNYAADATNNLAISDTFAKLTFFTVVNTSGAPVNATIKEKIFAANTFQWITLPFANLTGGVYLCWLYTEYTVGASSPNTDHHQFSWLQIAPIASGTVAGSGGSVTGTPTAAMSIYPLGYLSSGPDYGLTQPQIEARFAFGTNASTISMQRIKSTLSFIKA